MNYSEIESQRFDLNIIRGSAENIDLDSIYNSILANRADVLILRIPSTEQHTFYKLTTLPFPVISADTLVYYDCVLSENDLYPLKNQELVARIASSDDKELLNELINYIFKDYSTHYYSNPLFDREKILEGYTEWTLSYLENTSNKICFLFYRDNKPVAFATCQIQEEYGEGILYGVLPSAQGGGVYGDLIRYTKQYMLKQGLKKMKVSTQVQNYAVQKVWNREGFYLTNSFCTIHINSLLNKKVKGLNF